MTIYEKLLHGKTLRGEEAKRVSAEIGEKVSVSVLTLHLIVAAIEEGDTETAVRIVRELLERS